MTTEVGALKATMELDTVEFTKGIDEINRKIRTVESEFRSATVGIDKFGGSLEELQSKSGIISQKLELQKRKVDELKSRYDALASSQDANAADIDRALIAYNNATTAMKKTELQLEKINAQINQQSSKWQQLGNSLETIGSQMQTLGQNLTSVGQTLTTSVTLPLLGIGAAASNMAMNAVESENLFEVSMGKMADSARKWSEDLSKSLGLNSYEIRENVGVLNTMFTSMKLNETAALNMSEGLTELSYDMASFYNLKPEQAFEKLKAGITGETEPLKSLGILVDENTIKHYAYTHGIAENGKQLTEQQKVMARYGAIMEQTAKAQGDLARTADSPTNKLRIMKEQLSQMGIQIGQILIPIFERLMASLKPLLDGFQNLSKEQQELIVKLGLFAAAIGPIAFVLGKLISVGGTLAGIFSKVSLAIAEAGGIAAVFESAIAAITGPVGIAVIAITGLIAIFTALYKNNETFRDGVNKIWQQIQNYFEKALTFIGSIVRSVMTSVQSFFQEVLTKIKGFWKENGDTIMTIVKFFMNNIKSYIEMVMGVIKGVFEAVWPIIKAIVNTAWEGIKLVIKTALDIVLGAIQLTLKVIKGDWSGAWNTIKTTAQSIWKNIEQFFKNVDLVQIGKDIIQGLIDGMNTMVGAVIDKVSGIASIIKNAIKKALGINSPSRVMRDEVGKWIPEGLAMGITKNLNVVVSASERMATAAIPNATSLGSVASGETVNYYTMEPGAVVVSVKDLKEINEMSDFFKTFRQKFRASGVK